MDGSLLNAQDACLAKTDFCIAGFPKCGTTALARLLQASPRLNLARSGAHFEAPVYMPHLKAEPLAYDPDRPNGHKFAAYIYNPEALRRLYAQNPKTLFIFNIRPAAEALVSWREMHRRIAADNRVDHFTTRDDQTRAFYETCDLEAYYRAFAEPLLDYAGFLERFLQDLPDARYVIVSQERLSRDPAPVISHIHGQLRRKAPADYLAALPAGHRSRRRESLRSEAPETILKALEARDDALAQLLDRLQASQVFV